jgi:hypothetical protein
MHQYFICVGTYDLTFKNAINQNSYFNMPSTLSAYSICMWVKLPTYKGEYFMKEYGLLSYLPMMISSDPILFHLTVKYETQGIPTMVLKYHVW